MTNRVSVTFRGREVQNPIARALIVVLLAVATCVWVTLFVLIMVVLSPFAFALHYVLKALGRRGFVENTPSGIHINVSREGFRKAV